MREIVICICLLCLFSCNGNRVEPKVSEEIIYDPRNQSGLTREKLHELSVRAINERDKDAFSELSLNCAITGDFYHLFYTSFVLAHRDNDSLAFHNLSFILRQYADSTFGIKNEYLYFLLKEHELRNNDLGTGIEKYFERPFPKANSIPRR